MNKYEVEEWEANHDMPHEELMDEMNISYSELSAEIQRKIRSFDIIYGDSGYFDHHFPE